MTKSDYRDTLKIIADLGVVAGIAFLAIEIRQNTAMIEAQMSQSRAETAMAEAQSLYNSEYLPQIFVAIDSGERLTDLQMHRYVHYLRAFNRNQDNLLRQYTQGLLTENIPRSIEKAVEFEIAQREVAIKIWAASKSIYTDEYTRLVDGVIADYQRQKTGD